MPRSNRKKIGGLIQDVTNTHLSMGVREKKLTELEGLVKAELRDSTQKFDDVLKEFDEKLAPFEARFDEFLDKLAPSVDQADVDALVARVQHEVSLEKEVASKGQRQDAALMRRLRALKDTIPSASAPYIEPLSDAAFERMRDFSGLTPPEEDLAEDDVLSAEQLDEILGTAEELGKEKPTLPPPSAKPEAPAPPTANAPKDEPTRDLPEEGLARREWATAEDLDRQFGTAEKLVEEKPTLPPQSAEQEAPARPTANDPTGKPTRYIPEEGDLIDFADDSELSSQPVETPERDAPAVQMSSLTDTLEPEQPQVPSESLADMQHQVALVEQPPAEPTSSTDRSSIKGQIEQITSKLSLEGQKVLKTMSSGKNDNYTLELATLIQQRDQISANAKKADEKLSANPKKELTDEEFATQLQAEELDAVFQPKG